MEFELTEEQRMLRDSLRKFLEAELKPLDDQYGDREITPDRARELQRMLVPWGYLGRERPDDPVMNSIMTEELARIFPSLVGITGMTASAGEAIRLRAHPDVAGRLASGLLSGDLIGCNAITEPNAGSDPSSLQCHAQRRGDCYVINGAKAWISNGHIADVVVLVARTEPGSGPAGVSQFVIDRRQTPFRSRDTPTIGLRSWPTSELYFDDLEIPATNRLDGWGDGKGGPAQDPARSFGRVLAAIARARIFTGLISVGIAQRAFEIALDYVKVRKQFGREIGRFQLVQRMVAEMATEIDAARLLCYRAADVSRRRRSDAQVSMAKAYATEMGVRVCSIAMQCLGANGLAAENRVERCLRDARMLTVPDGTTQIQQLIIGRDLLGMSAIR